MGFFRAGALRTVVFEDPPSLGCMTKPHAVVQSYTSLPGANMGVSKILCSEAANICGIPIIRIIISWGLYWGPSIEGIYHMSRQP